MDGIERKNFDVKWPIEIEQYERKIFDLKQLIEISKGLNSTLDYNTLIDSILLTCMGQLQLMMAGIFLKKGLGHETFILHRNYKGFDVDHSKEYAIPDDSKLAAILEHNFKCYTMEELELLLKEDSALTIIRLLDLSIMVPLISKGKLNGIIILGERINQTDFSELEIEFLLNIASLAGIAINNAALYEMATTDMMTKLKIHHYFQAILSEELERAERLKRPLSLIMADIDHFKLFNDDHGHVAGDHVLIKVAQIIKENIRLMDIAARYGGEEFAIILPKTDITEALIVAERIRESVENTRVIFAEKSLNVTISIGISQFDQYLDKNKEDLITRADKALYVSKHNGRNKVSFL